MKNKRRIVLFCVFVFSRVLLFFITKNILYTPPNVPQNMNDTLFAIQLLFLFSTTCLWIQYFYLYQKTSQASSPKEKQQNSGVHNMIFSIWMLTSILFSIMQYVFMYSGNIGKSLLIGLKQYIAIKYEIIFLVDYLLCKKTIEYASSKTE